MFYLWKNAFYKKLNLLYWNCYSVDKLEKFQILFHCIRTMWACDRKLGLRFQISRLVTNYSNLGRQLHGFVNTPSQMTISFLYNAYKHFIYIKTEFKLHHTQNEHLM